MNDECQNFYLSFINIFHHVYSLFILDTFRQLCGLTLDVVDYNYLQSLSNYNLIGIMKYFAKVIVMVVDYIYVIDT